MTLRCQRARCRDQREKWRGSPQAGKLAGSASGSFPLAFSPLSGQPNMGTVRAGMEHTEERVREVPCPQGAPEAARKVAVCRRACRDGDRAGVTLGKRVRKPCPGRVVASRRGLPSFRSTPGACILRNGRPLMFSFLSGVAGASAQVEECPRS